MLVVAFVVKIGLFPSSMTDSFSFECGEALGPFVPPVSEVTGEKTERATT